MKKMLIRKQYKHYLIGLLIAIIMGFTFYNNKVGATTSDKYLIKVNKQQNCVTIYEKDSKGKYTIPVKAMVCSTGGATPIGTFKTPVKYRWKLLMGNVWGQYSTRIHGGILFHSVWYYQQDPSTLSAAQYNKLGTTCSHGCIRLTVADAKWIYDNCPLGTTVTIYNDKDPGPLGKPTAIKLPAGTGWDPTDIYSKANPYNDKKPSISGVKSQKVKYGAKINIAKGVTAKTSMGIAANDKISISIMYNNKKVKSLNTKKPGKYKITYIIQDELGKSASKTATITVLQQVQPLKLVGVKDLYVKSNTKINRAFALENVNASKAGKTFSKKKIKVIISKVSDLDYEVTYSVTSGTTVTKSCNITVDSEPPIIYGVEDKEISQDAVVDREFVLKGITVGDDTTFLNESNIRTKIVDNQDGTYKVTYTVKDAVGNVMKETAIFTVVDAE